MSSGLNGDAGAYGSERKRRIAEQKSLDRFSAGSGCCMICFNSNPDVLEEHHPFGKKHGKWTLTLCANHHALLTRMQGSWPKVWLQNDIPQSKRVALMLRGLSDLTRVMSDELLHGDNYKSKRGESE